LSGVDLQAPAGLQFSGKFLRPGSTFDPERLPRPAVLIESVGSVRTAAARSRYSFEHMWILWRFDFARGDWIEVAQGVARDASWTVDIAPIAYRLLFSSAGSIASRSVEMSARPIVVELASFIDEKLNLTTRELRCFVLAEIERHLGNHIAEAQKWRRAEVA
jgi:hypothetical protein